MKSVSEVAHCTVKDVFKIEGGEPSEELRKYLTEYVQPFAKPTMREGTEGGDFALDNLLCLKCGQGLSGMFGSFTWGMVHGEGFCRKCRWPARLYHYLKLPDGTEGRMVLLLQYHPDFVEEKEDED